MWEGECRQEKDFSVLKVLHLTNNAYLSGAKFSRSKTMTPLVKIPGRDTDYGVKSQERIKMAHGRMCVTDILPCFKSHKPQNNDSYARLYKTEV